MARTWNRAYRVKVANADKESVLAITNRVLNLDSLDRLATNRGKAIRQHRAMTRRTEVNSAGRSMLRNTAARIGQLNEIWDGLTLKPKPENIKKAGNRASVWQRAVDTLIFTEDHKNRLDRQEE